MKPIVYGARYSVYVRAVCLTLTEKSVPYELVEVDVFSADGLPSEHLRRQPFGRIPAFEHGGFSLYETGAITRYIDESFSGPALQPSDPPGRARMNQIISVLDNYVYRTLVWDIYVERVSRPANGRPTDEARVAAALPRARVCLQALEDLMKDGPWLIGSKFTLADLHAAPMLTCFRMASEGSSLLEKHATLKGWCDRMAARPIMAATQATLR